MCLCRDDVSTTLLGFKQSWTSNKTGKAPWPRLELGPIDGPLLRLVLCAQEQSAKALCLVCFCCLSMETTKGNETLSLFMLDERRMRALVDGGEERGWNLPLSPCAECAPTKAEKDGRWRGLQRGGVWRCYLVNLWLLSSTTSFASVCQWLCNLALRNYFWNPWFYLLFLCIWGVLWNLEIDQGVFCVH